MSDISKAIEALNSGDKNRAFQLLAAIIDENPGHEDAWLWMYAVVDTPQKKRQALETVLQINPGNETAKKYLAALTGKECPYCLSIIDARATVCPHCQRDMPLTEKEQKERRRSTVYSWLGIIFLCCGLPILGALWLNDVTPSYDVTLRVTGTAGFADVAYSYLPEAILDPTSVPEVQVPWEHSFRASDGWNVYMAVEPSGNPQRGYVICEVLVNGVVVSTHDSLNIEHIALCGANIGQ